MAADILKKRFLELDRMNYERDIPMHSQFLTLPEQDELLQVKKEMRGRNVMLTAGYEEGERKIAYFPASYEEDPESSVPIDWIKAAPANEKFAEELTHRDFLGALMSLGIERDRTGDILIDGKTAYIACLPEITDYIVSELISVRHTKMSCERTELPEHYKKPNIKEISASASSARLDTIIGIAFRLSRGKSQEAIKAGSVFVNGQQELSVSRILKNEDRVSLRHKGKFIYLGASGESKKGRSFVKLGIYGG